jgi:ParB/RepB/Spo0J family partition protein
LADNTQNKFKKFDYIELDTLYVGLSNVRTENVNDEDEIANLAEHIGQHGLLEPIVVFEVDDLSEGHPLFDSRKEYSGKFEILAGQRRWTAFKELNKNNPGKGWDKIPCHIREPPDDDIDAKAISLGEGLTQLPFTLADTMNACNELFKVHNDVKIVSKKTGISQMLVKRYVKFKRLPNLVQEKLGEISKSPKTATVIAVEAFDALSGGGVDVDEEKVLTLAKKLGEKKKKSQEDYKKMKQAAEENPSQSIEKIEEESLKITNPKKLTLMLAAPTNKKLEDAAEEHGVSPEDEAEDIIETGLGIRQSND